MKKIKNVTKGFTLIELLVVVLIISILAAIALPQYRNARDKTIISSYLPTLRAIKDAEEVYYMTHGKYAEDFTALDIDTTKTCPSVYSGMIFCKKGYINLVNIGYIRGDLALFYCPSFSGKMNVSNYPNCSKNSKVTLTMYLDYYSTNHKIFKCDGPKNICSMFK